MRYLKVSSRPTKEQLREIEAVITDAAALGASDEFILGWDETKYDQPRWLSGAVVNIPGEIHRCTSCGEPI